MTPLEIRLARERLGLSQREFAAAVGLDGETADRRVRGWEQGEYRPGGPAIKNIKRLLAERVQQIEESKP